MCIRDRIKGRRLHARNGSRQLSAIRDLDGFDMLAAVLFDCLLYTSDAADERSSVDLGGRRIIKKKTTTRMTLPRAYTPTQ